MGTIKKKRIKIKKKNFAIFIIFVMVFAFAITQIAFIIIKLATTPKEVEKKEEKKPTIVEKNLTDYEKKIKELNNVNEQVNYFKRENIDRYINYKKKNKNLDDIQIIKNVNMNLDLTPYQDKIEAINKNQMDILVNKYYYLDETYVPKNLKKISTRYALSGMKLVDYAKEAFEDMAKDAAKEKLNIVAMSTYRSYNYQVSLYNRYARSDGKDKADTYSGRPGFSEHQTGLAVDVYDQELNYTSFEKTNEFKWMQKHAHEYGFILRFPKNKEEETGYIYESWHYRYVGRDIANYIHENNITLEEYIATH